MVELEEEEEEEECGAGGGGRTGALLGFLGSSNLLLHKEKCNVTTNVEE